MDQRGGLVSYSWASAASSRLRSQGHQLLALLSWTRYLTFLCNVTFFIWKMGIIIALFQVNRVKGDNVYEGTNTVPGIK